MEFFIDIDFLSEIEDGIILKGLFYWVNFISEKEYVLIIPLVNFSFIDCIKNLGVLIDTSNIDQLITSTYKKTLHTLIPASSISKVNAPSTIKEQL